MADDIEATCSSCGENATDLQCRCGLRKYCSKKCASSDSKSHKALCGDTRREKQLQRVADTLQSAYFAMLENFYESQAVKVEKDGQDLRVYGKHVKFTDYKFADFPSGLVTTEQDKASLLCEAKCQNCLALMYTPLSMLVKGVQQHRLNFFRLNPTCQLT